MPSWLVAVIQTGVVVAIAKSEFETASIGNLQLCVLIFFIYKVFKIESMIDRLRE